MTSSAAVSLPRMTALYGVCLVADVSCFKAAKGDALVAMNTGSLAPVGLWAIVWDQKLLWALFLPLVT